MSNQIGMPKLICASSFGTEVGLVVRFMDAPRTMAKTASTVFGCDYSHLKAPDGHIGMHVTALGDWEHWGANRNYDTFPKAACAKYHDTFVKHARVYRNHRSKADKLGKVAASAYDPHMGRIELFLHVDKNAAARELDMYARDGESRLSMGCSVPGDRCTKCAQFRKNKYDPNMCDHVRHKLGHVLEDGTLIATHNDDPTFNDISFIHGKQADRTAYDLKVAGVSMEVTDSATLADMHDAFPPLSVLRDSDRAEKVALAMKLAGMERMLRTFAASAHAGEHAFAKCAAGAVPEALDDESIECLRDLTPAEMCRKLADMRVVLGPEEFFAYSLGGRKSAHYAEVAPHALGIAKRGLFGTITADESLLSRTVLLDYFDVDAQAQEAYPRVIQSTFGSAHNKIAACALTDEAVRARSLEASAAGTVDVRKIARDDVRAVNEAAAKVAAVYAAYKLSALCRILPSQANQDMLLATTAMQDLLPRGITR